MKGAKTHNAIIVAIIAAAMIFPSVLAANITVGGSTGWDLSSNLTLWSSSTQFFVNDSLVFNYSIVHDVLEVNEQDFLKCRRTSPIKAYANGEDTIINLTHSGTIYYICGRSNYCALGLKVQINVLDHRDETPVMQPNFTQPGLQKSDACKNVRMGFLLVIPQLMISCSIIGMPIVFRMMVFFSASVCLVLGNHRYIALILDQIKGPTRESERPQPMGRLRAFCYYCYMFTGATLLSSVFWFDINEANFNQLILVHCCLLYGLIFEGRLPGYVLNLRRRTSSQQAKPGPQQPMTVQHEPQHSASKDVKIGLQLFIILSAIEILPQNEIPTLHILLVRLISSMLVPFCLRGLFVSPSEHLRFMN